MTFSVCSNYRLKSILLRNDPKFLRAFNRCSIALFKWRETEPFPVFWTYHRMVMGVKTNECLQEMSEHIMFLDRVMELDRVIKRVEKSDKLRELLAGTMLAINTSVLPALRNYGGIKYAAFSCPVDEGERLESLNSLFLDSVSASALESAFNVVVAAVVLLSLVYQYLIGYVDRGGSKTYSSGSLDFRDTYVAIVLFQGAYVWIKFRQAARPGASRKRKSSETQVVQFGAKSEVDGVYARPMKDKLGTITHYKYEPRLKPPRERVDSGTTLKFNCLSLGRYNTPGEAKIVRQIAAFYYEKGEGRVKLEDGSYFSIPRMSEKKSCLTGMEKAKWVTWKAKEVYADLQKENERLKQLNMATTTGAPSGHGSDAGTDLSPSAVAVTCSSPIYNSADELTWFPEISPVALVQSTPSHGGNGAEPLPALIEQISDLFQPGNGNGDFDMPGEENDVPATNDHGKVAGHADDYSETFSGSQDMIKEFLNSDGHDVPLQQPSVLDYQMHHIAVNAILGDPSPPQVDAATQAFELVDSQLSPNLQFQLEWDLVGAVSQNIVMSGSSPFLKQLRDPVLQQLVNRQKKKLEDYAIRMVGLEHQLSESEIQVSELQREKSELQQENERLRTMLQQVAKSQVATWSGIIIDIPQKD